MKPSTNGRRKKVGSISLPPECFAYVGDLKEPHTWKLPLFHVNKQRALNLVISAVQRFEVTSIPKEHRAAAWRKVTEQAFRHNVPVPAKMPALKPKPAPPQAQQQQSAVQQQKLSVETLAQKQARAEADYRAEAFLKSIGFWSDEREDN